MAWLEIYQAGCALAGAGDDCHIKLTRADVSRHHMQLVVSSGKITVIDLGSSNGTIIGSSKDPIFSQQPVDVPSGCDIKLGRSTTLKIFLSGTDQDEKAPDPKVEKAVERKSEVVQKLDMTMPGKGEIPKLDISGIPAALRPVAQEIKKQAHRELLVRLNLKKLALSGVSEKELNRRAEEMVKEILSQLTVKLPAGLRLEVIEKELPSYYEKI